MPMRSRNWSARCAPPRNGAMSSARWISGWSGKGWTRGDWLSSCPGTAVRRTASLPLAYVPGIHVYSYGTKDVDGRDKPGHDGEIDYCSRNLPEAICGRPVTGQL